MIVRERKGMGRGKKWTGEGKGQKGRKWNKVEEGKVRDVGDGWRSEGEGDEAVKGRSKEEREGEEEEENGKEGTEL